MRYKDPEKEKAYQKQYREDKKEELKSRRREKKEELKAYNAKRYEENKEENITRVKAYNYNINAQALAMIDMKVICDAKIWHIFCNIKRKCAKKTPYPEDFTDEMIFEKMKNGCVYCGSIASTLDRIDSSLNHTPENCVSCCWPCNQSKGNGDPDSFIRKAFYRSRGEYFDDICDIWADNIYKPIYTNAKINSQRQKRQFTLMKEEWNEMVVGNCAYCRRLKPNDKWNGVDRVVPADGYTRDNTVSCCSDCNNDKGKFCVKDVKIRNEMIADRLENGIITLFMCKTRIRNNGNLGKDNTPAPKIEEQLSSMFIDDD